MIFNTRFETSFDLEGPTARVWDAVEVLAYGTAVIP